MGTGTTVLRSMHDLGLGAWFGGSIMGAIGLNGGAATAKDPSERLRISSAGWGRWAPVLSVAIGAHAIGSVGMLAVDGGRVAGQKGNGAPVALKIVLTLGAAAASLYSGLVGTRQAAHADEGAKGVTEVGGGESPQLAGAQRQQKILQWIVPAATAVLIVLAAQQGEKQRVDSGLLSRVLHR